MKYPLAIRNPSPKSTGPIFPKLYVPQSFGKVKNPGILAHVSSTTFELVKKHGLPLASGLTGSNIIRFRPKGKHDATMREQGSTPNGKPKEVMDRFYPVLPEFLDFDKVSVMAQESLKKTTGRFFGISFGASHGERIKYTSAEELRQLKASLDSESQNVADSLISLTGVLGFRYWLRRTPIVADLRVDSDEAKSFFHDLGRDEGVQEILGSMGLGSISDALVLPDSYDFPTAITMGMIAANPGLKGVMYTSSPNFAKGMKRNNLVLYDSPGIILPELEPMDILTFKIENGAIVPEAQPADDSYLDMVKPIILPADLKKE